MLYNSDFICTYHYYDVVISPNLPPSIKEQVEGFGEISNLLYQAELLQVFHLTSLQEDKLNQKINELYNLIVDNNDLKECMTIAAARIFSEDLVMGFMVLFSYRYFYLLHPCICDFLKNNQQSISKANVKALNKSITSAN